MNSTELKTHFYKRFSGEHGKMVFSQAGLPCSLLGYINTDHTSAISTSLSMRIRVIAREIGSRSITITSTFTDMRRIYRIDMSDGRDRISEFLLRANACKLKGSEILYDSTIPDFYDPHIAYTAAIANAVFDVSGLEKLPCEKMAELCAQRNEKNAYLTVFGHREGYAVCAKDGSIKNLPLPMQGYKFIIASVREKYISLSQKSIDKTFMMLKELFPHISSFGDIDDDMLKIASQSFKSHSVNMLTRHLRSESRRVIEGEKALLGCNTGKFAACMRESFLSQKHLCDYNDTRVFLGDKFLAHESVIGARICENGIIAIVKEEECDDIIRDVRFDYEREFGYPPLFCVAKGL